MIYVLSIPLFRASSPISLRCLKSHLSSRQLKIITGLIMSRFRYCLPVWGTEFVRFNESDPISSIIHDLQVVQNDLLRIITGCKRREHVRIRDMLDKTKMLSINQLIAYSMIREKSHTLQHCMIMIATITGLFAPTRQITFVHPSLNHLRCVQKNCGTCRRIGLRPQT